MAWIGRSWDPATVSALAAIFGSFVGAFASTLSAWLTQTHHDRRDLLAKRILIANHGTRTLSAKVYGRGPRDAAQVRRPAGSYQFTD